MGPMTGSSLLYGGLIYYEPCRYIVINNTISTGATRLCVTDKSEYVMNKDEAIALALKLKKMFPTTDYWVIEMGQYGPVPHKVVPADSWKVDGLQ